MICTKIFIYSILIGLSWGEHLPEDTQRELLVVDPLTAVTKLSKPPLTGRPAPRPAVPTTAARPAAVPRAAISAPAVRPAAHAAAVRHAAPNNTTDPPRVVTVPPTKPAATKALKGTAAVKALKAAAPELSIAETPPAASKDPVAAKQPPAAVARREAAGGRPPATPRPASITTRKTVARYVPEVPTELVLQPKFDGCAANMDECVRATNLAGFEACREAVEMVAGCEFLVKHVRALVPPLPRYQCHSDYVWGVDLSVLSGYTLLKNMRIRGLWEEDCKEHVHAYTTAELDCNVDLNALTPSSISEGAEKGDLVIEFNEVDISNTTRYLFTRPSCAIQKNVTSELVLSLSLIDTPDNMGAPYETMILRDSPEFADAIDGAAPKMVIVGIMTIALMPALPII